jgi:hypothetical protein
MLKTGARHSKVSDALIHSYKEHPKIDGIAAATYVPVLVIEVRKSIAMMR